MEKLLVMQVAAQLANAVMVHVGDKLPVDVDIKDPTLRAEDLMLWELFRIFYHGALAALQDDKDWPAPQLSAAGLLQGLITPDKLASLLPMVGSLLGTDKAKAVVDTVRGLLAGPAPVAPVITGPLPNPGEKK